MRCREHPPLHTHLSVPCSKPRTCPPRHKLRYHVKNLRSLLDLFPLEELSHYNHSGHLQVFFTQLEPNVHGVRQSSHVSVETNSNKRISVLGTNHTKIYRVNLVGFKHRAEDPARSPHEQSKYTLRSKRFSNVLTNHQGRFPKPWDRQDSQLNLETVPEAKPLTNRGTFHKRLTLMILHIRLLGHAGETGSKTQKPLHHPKTQGPKKHPQCRSLSH